MGSTKHDYGISATTVYGIRLIELSGGVDPVNFEDFQKDFAVVLEGDGKSTLVDLSRTVYVCTACWGLLLRAEDELRKSGGSFGLVVPPGPVEKMLKTLGFDRNLRYYGTRDEALLEFGD